MRLKSVALVAAGISAIPGVLTAQAFVHEAQLLGRGEPYGRPLARLGVAVAVSGDTVVVGAPSDDTAAGDSAGAVYVFERSAGAWTERQRLVASDSEAFALFGSAVSITGDTLLVGAPRANAPNNIFASGAVYVFVRSNGTWTEQQRLTAPTPASSAQFGTAVSLAGDTAAVGAPYIPQAGHFGPGLVHVFTRAGATWSMQQTISAPDVTPQDGFGGSVSLSADTLVVGAPQDDDVAGTDVGAAYVFVRSGTTWTQQQKLAAVDPASLASFGDAVSVSGDTVTIGAGTADPPYPASGTGAAYVFVRSGASWSQQAKLLASDGAVGHGFGRAVSLEGETLAVGAPRAGGTGAAYVFVRAGTVWSEQQRLVASDAAMGDVIGISVSLSTDTLVAGAPGDDVPARDDAGAAAVFVRSGPVWTEQQELVGSDGPAIDILGYSVSVSGDTVVAGAANESGAETLYSGAAYVYVRSGANWTTQQKLRAADPRERDQFGFSVAVSGDTAVIGARGDTLVSFPGSAYVFVRSGGTWTQQQKLVSPDGTGNDGFGWTVSISGDTIVVGAHVADTASPDTGAAYVFVRSGNVWTLQQKLVAADAATNDGFGKSVSVEGDTVVIGSWFDETQPTVYTGSAYVFVRSGTTWTQQQKLLAPDGDLLDRFGWSVSLSGDTAIAGAPFAGPSAGGAYVFTRAGTSWSFQQKLVANEPTFGYEFGNSVSVSGDAAVVGAYRSVPLETGAAYVFQRSGATWAQEQPTLQAPDGTAGDWFGFAVALSGDALAVGADQDVTGGEQLAGSVHVYRVAVGSDLAMAKTDGQATAVPGEALVYTLTVSNHGPRAVTAATVTDVLPAALLGATWTCIASGGSSCTPGGSGSISDTVSLPNGGTATYTVTGTVSATATGALANTATVAPPVGVTDPDLGNNSATDVDTLTPRADLGVTKTDSADPVSPGDPLRYTLSASNAGPSAATAVTLVDTLPPGVGFVSSSPGPPLCTLAGATLTCALGALGPGAGTAVTVDVAVNASTGGVLANTASVSGNEDDPNPANDSGSATTVVRGAVGELVHGFVALEDLAAQPGPTPDEDVFLISQQPHASYEIVVDGASGDVGSDMGPSLERIGPDGTTVLQVSRPTGPGPGRSLRFRNATSSVIVDQTIRVRSAGCGSDCGSDDVYRLRAYETTGAVPRFNNTGTQVTILVLQNPSAETIAGDIFFHAPSGALAATQPFQLHAKAALVLNTATVPGAAGLSGTIVVAHDGPYGALAGKAVAVEPATGFTFDSPLSSRPR